MIMNIHAERDGDFLMHMHSSQEILAYFFITNRTNYARWLPVYLLGMVETPEDGKEAFQAAQVLTYQARGSLMVFGVTLELRQQ